MRVLRLLPFALAIVLAGPACFVTRTASADDGLFGDDEASTAQGDILESSGDYARGLGKGALLRSMSAVQLQRALEMRLQNREESVEQYYELQELRADSQPDARGTIDDEKARRLAKQAAPDRLSENQINRQTGQLYWPKPLDHDALKPYRKPIEETLAKRSSPGHTYRRMDYLKVQRMIDLMRESVESIQDKLDSNEVVALKGYLDQIAYDARFDAADERVDY
ncbi:hypothetical protein [Novipirellula caenicola]|uniref:Uncharacterized protein n=1 Tax=Novipirellula caenicola TaxID=1536901 RepID=A0ABP9VQT2_9BACT